MAEQRNEREGGQGVTGGTGKVYLVGAGPGDPGLITLRGVECLRRADVVLYDYLVNPCILEHARPVAELVCLGRHGQGRIVPQDEINERLVQEARKGRVVVRLKGGDPAVFARGAEEAEKVAAAGIPWEIVPGITAAMASGSHAGIPLTHRDLASSVAFVTGQQRSDDHESELDFDSLAKFPGTLVMYMGVTTAPHWTSALLAGGRPPDEPTAIVRRCSWPDQQVIRCQLDQVAGILASQKIRPPVIVIIGQVVRLTETLDWFAQRPLFGQTVLVTRPSDQARSMRDRLIELGATVLLQEAIRIADPPDWSEVDHEIAKVQHYDWLVFSSVNGVQYFLDRLEKTRRDLRDLGSVKLAAIGPASSDRLAQYRLRVDIRPDQFRAEALVEALLADAPEKRFLLTRASRGREVLAEQLTAAGAHVTQIVVYSSQDVSHAKPRVVEALRQGRVNWTTVTSSAIAHSVANLFGDDLKKTKLVSISPLTSDTLRTKGFEPAAEATEYTTEGVIDAIVTSSAAREH